MKTYVEKQREIPIIEEVDVLVLGAGPAGVAAAVSAGREGAKTTIIEQLGELGGVATAGLMSHWTGQTQGGIYEEILDRSFERCPGADTSYTGNIHYKEKQIINHEKLKLEMIKMLEEAQVNIRLYSFACEAIVEEDTIKGVIIESKSGREAILAKVVIDCTGDGDIAAKAGADYIKGREEDGKMQPMTLMIQVGGVDLSKIQYLGGFEDTYEVPEGDVQTLGRKYLETPAGHVLIYPAVYPNIVTLNMTNCIDVDGTKAEDLTKAEIKCFKQIHTILAFLKNHIPGFEESYLFKVSSYIGVRETRHFKGLETITEQDIMEARVFENWAVTKAYFNFDVHNITGCGLDETGCQQKFSQPKGYTIPYGCFVPVKIDNLMVAGRNISGTHIAHANYRVMPICANMGQAVGIAAAMCCKENIKPRELNVSQLQKRLIELGVEP